MARSKADGNGSGAKAGAETGKRDVFPLHELKRIADDPTLPSHKRADARYLMARYYGFTFRRPLYRFGDFDAEE